jgi:hypothetical protein
VDAHYDSLGHPMPLHVNPAEFLLEQVNIDFAQDKESAALQLAQMQAWWASSESAKDLGRAIEDAEQKSTGLEVEKAEKRPGMISLIVTLLHRSFIKSYRDIIVYGIRFAMYMGRSPSRSERRMNPS